MSRTVAVTGATGFIGSALTQRLLQEGWGARILVRSSPGSGNFAGQAVEQVRGSLDDGQSLNELVRDVDAVIHCAGSVRGISASDFNRVNAEGVSRLARVAAGQSPRPRFLSLSSLAAREPQLSPYAASKLEGERALEDAAGDMEWLALRPPAVYGPGDREMLPLFRWMMRGLVPVIGPADARFSLLYIEDLVDAIMQWLVSEGCHRGVFELHDGRAGGYDWGQVVATVAALRGRGLLRVRLPESALKLIAGVNITGARIMGYAPMLTPGKVRELRHRDWVCDNTALTHEIGWVPRVDFSEGLRRTLGLPETRPVQTPHSC
jgi:nucleoside-diphosphate-sugar epimerase